VWLRCLGSLSGWFLDDLVLTPVDHLPSAERKAQCLSAQASLADRIAEYQPAAIVIVLTCIKDVVEAAAMAAGSNAHRYVVPFPGNGQRRRFLDAMVCIVPLPRAK
jgi:hypothetical protein